MASNARIERASLGDGIGWLSNGGNLLARGGAPMVRIALVLFLFSLLQWLPLIGPIAFVLVTPALTAGLLNVFRAVEQGESPTLDRLLAGLTDRRVRAPLLGVGVVLLLGFSAAFLVLYARLAQQMDLAELIRLAGDPDVINSQPQRILAMFEGVNLLGGMALALLILALVLGAVYFAAPLVFFWNWPVFAALLFSLRAMLVNWIAFLGFGLVAIGLAVLIGIMALLFGGILALALGSVGAFLSDMLLLGLSMFLQLLMGAAQWKAFMRIFPAGDSGPTAATGADSDGSDDDGSMSA